MKISRLNRLIEILEKVPEELFDMTIWATRRNGMFAGCACGWASQSPEFQKDGLSFEIGDCGMVSYNDILTGKVKGTYGMANFFEIDYATADRLFESDFYNAPEKITPADVIARIRELLNSG